MSVLVNGREFDAEFILSDLDAAGHYELAEWAQEHLSDEGFCKRLSDWAEGEYEINGDPDAGYDESSAVVTALRSLHGLWSDPPDDPSSPLDRSPRGRLSGLAEETR